ncbi:MAG: hypothetical protein J5543_07105 [Bacteroidales bacterium]|jgi:hypothetical protein|nr:hypothetical protein [Bacteroidales bacterium]
MKLFKTLLFSALAACTLTSCLGSDDESENTYTAYGFYTITGSLTAGYTLYSDMGGKVIPTAASVADITNKEGFGSHTRAMLYFRYKANQVSADQKTITGAELYDGRYFDELYPMSKDYADRTLVTSEDSTFQVREFMDVWAYRGYLNTVFNGAYSSVNDINIKPTINLVYDPASITENAITFDVYYNRHSAKNANANGPVYFYTSHYLNRIDELVPGSDDVTITIKSTDGITKEIKVSRQDFYPGHYE